MIVACCFAILQALQPFIHAHLDGEHHSHGEGFHTVQNHESTHATEHLNDHAVSDAGHATHTIAVPTGIKQEKSAFLMMDVLAFALVCIWLALVFVPCSNRFPPLPLISSNTLRRRLPAPRASPLF